MGPLRRTALGLGLAATCVAAWGGAASAHPAWRTPATAGARPYRYEVIETANGHIQNGFRTDFDLDTARNGSTDAVVRTTETSTDGKTWTAVSPSAACRAAMHAPPGDVARVRLWPMGGGGGLLDASFLDLCAPDAVFLPLTDILNVLLIPLSPTFNTAGLHKVGDHAAYDGFAAAFSRGVRTMKETSPGGEVSLAALDRAHATIDWAPAIADLDLQEPGPQGQVIGLKGTEHFAFRVVVDVRSGALVSARSTYDDLALAMHMAGVPNSALPPQAITRAVTITPR